MEDSEKTKEQLINELAKLGQQITKLKESEIKRKEVEKTLRESEKKYRALVQNTNSIVLRMNINGCITFFNGFAQKFFGYTEDEILGKNLVGTIVPEMSTSHHNLSVMIKDIIKNPERYSVNENENIRRNGERVWILWTNKVVFDKDGNISEILCIGNDITLRKRAEEKMKIEKDFSDCLFESSESCLFLINSKKKIVRVNDAALKVFGRKREEVIGRICHEFICPAAKGKCPILDLGQKVDHSDKVALNSEGEKVPIIKTVSQIEKEGEIHLLESFVDITERKQNEELQEVLYNISKSANSPISLDELYRSIHKELDTIIDASNFYISLIDEKKDTLYFPYYRDEKDDILSPILNFSKSNTLNAYLFKTGKPLLINSRKLKELEEQKELSVLGTVTDEWVWLGAPLKIGDKTIGSMAIQHYTIPDLYTGRDIKLLEFISSQVTIAIERKRAEEELKRLAHYDTLTGAYNRGYGLELLQRQLKLAKRNKSSLLLAYSDLDNLKDINDEFSHEEGDSVMVQVAKLFKSILREVDIIIRMGGDEFLVIFLDSSLSEITTIRKRLNIELAQINRISKKPYKIGLSTGFSNYDPENPSSMEKLIKVADEKMYKEKKSKNKGR